MSLSINLVAKNRASVTLIAIKEEAFIDANFNLISNRFSSHKEGLPLVEIVQKTRIAIQVALLNPDGSTFDLSLATTMTLGLFQRVPQQTTISLTAGSIAGVPSDGVINFVLSEADTDFSGFATGQVNIVTSSGVQGFEEFQAVYRRNLFA